MKNQWVKIIISILIVAIIIGIAFLTGRNRYLSNAVKSYNDGWSVNVSGENREIEIPIELETTLTKEQYIITKTIDLDDVKKSIMFTSNYAEITASVDGVNIGSFGNIKKPFVVPPGREVIFIPILEEYGGKTLALEITEYTDSLIDSFYIGKEADLILTVVLTSIPMFTTALIMLILSVILLIIPIVNRKTNFEMVILGIIYILSSYYVIARTFLVDIILSEEISMLTLLIVVYFMQICLLLFGHHISTKKSLRVIYKVLLCVTTLGYPVFTGSLLFNPNNIEIISRTFQNASAIYLILAAITILLKRDKKRLPLLIGFILLFVAFVLDLLKVQLFLKNIILIDYFFFKITLLIYILLHIFDLATEYYKHTIDMDVQIKTEQSTNILYKESIGASYEYVKNVRAIKHDMVSHLNILRYYVEERKTDKIKDYIDELIDSNKGSVVIKVCENYLVNAIINDTVVKSSKKNIAFKYEVDIKDEINISENQLCSLFNNIISNAIEACELCLNSYIDLKVHTQNRYLCIRCKNSYVAPIIKKDNLFVSIKQDDNDHGLGMQIIDAIVKKHDGIMDIHYTDSEFVMDVAVKLMM
jgi:two-component system, LytTR family, sensor histidine kinase AgrC